MFLTVSVMSRAHTPTCVRFKPDFAAADLPGVITWITTGETAFTQDHIIVAEFLQLLGAATHACLVEKECRVVDLSRAVEGAPRRAVPGDEEAWFTQQDRPLNGENLAGLVNVHYLALQAPGALVDQDIAKQSGGHVLDNLCAVGGDIHFCLGCWRVCTFEPVRLDVGTITEPGNIGDGTGSRFCLLTRHIVYFCRGLPVRRAKQTEVHQSDSKGTGCESGTHAGKRAAVAVRIAR